MTEELLFCLDARNPPQERCPYLNRAKSDMKIDEKLKLRRLEQTLEPYIAVALHASIAVTM